MLVRVMGFRGLALGTAIAAIFNAVVLLWLLRGRARRPRGTTRRRRAREDHRRVAADGRCAAHFAAAWLDRADAGGR